MSFRTHYICTLHFTGMKPIQYQGFYSNAAKIIQFALDRLDYAESVYLTKIEVQSREVKLKHV